MKKPIDITDLKYEELIELNRKIVEQIRFLQQRDSYLALAKYRVGDRVSFKPQPGKKIEGIIVRVNKKTVSIATDDDRHWNVAPVYLTKVTASQGKLENANVLSLSRT